MLCIAFLAVGALQCCAQAVPITFHEHVAVINMSEWTCSDLLKHYLPKVDIAGLETMADPYDGTLPQSSTAAYVPPHLMVNQVLIHWPQEAYDRGWAPMHHWKLRIRQLQVQGSIELDLDWVQTFQEAKEVAIKLCTGEYSVRREIARRAFSPRRQEVLQLTLGDSIWIP